MAYDEARQYLPSIVVERGGSDAAAAQALVVLEELHNTVHPVPEGVYESHRADALSRIDFRDPDDWPILGTRDDELPISSEDQDFFGAGVPTVDHGPRRDLPPALGVTDRGLTWHEALPHQTTGGLACAVLGRRPEMAVGVQRGRRRRVAERALDGDDVAAGGDQAGGVEVPEVVEPDAAAARRRCGWRASAR